MLSPSESVYAPTLLRRAGRTLESRWAVRNQPLRGGASLPLPGVVTAQPGIPGEVAQLVEHTTENRGVASSILALAIRSVRNRPGDHRAYAIGL